MTSIEKSKVERLILAVSRDSSFDLCSICENNIQCTDCPHYSQGKGMVDEDGNYFDWDWTCQDFDICMAREGTPCDGCYYNNKSEDSGKGFSLNLSYEL